MPRRTIPPETKAKALEMLKAPHEGSTASWLREVTRVTGVSEATLQNWRRNLPHEHVRSPAEVFGTGVPTFQRPADLDVPAPAQTPVAAHTVAELEETIRSKDRTIVALTEILARHGLLR